MPLVADVKRAVARHYGLPVDELTGNGRAYSVSHPRQLAMAIACEVTRHKQSRVGNFFNRDHTTVLHARRQVARRVVADPEVAAALQAVRAELGVEEMADG